MYYYSPSTGSFYTSSSNLPTDALLLTEQQYQALLNGHTVEGLDILLLDGNLVLTVLPEGILYYYGEWNIAGVYPYDENIALKSTPVVLYKGVQYIATAKPTPGVLPYDDPAWRAQGKTAPVLFKGDWSAATNTPFLQNGIGIEGDFYRAITAGNVNFGAGLISFQIGDIALYSNSQWINGGSINNSSNIFLPFDFTPSDIPIGGGESVTVAFENTQGQLNNRQILIQSVIADDIVIVDAQGQTQDSGKAFSIDDTLSADSDALISTQKAVKGYVDTNIATLDSEKQDLISTPTANDIVITDNTGQTQDSGKHFSTDNTLGGISASDDAISTQLAVKTYVDNQDNLKQNLIISPIANDFTYTDASGQTFDSGISLSTDTSLGGSSSSNLLVPTQLAIKSYVDAVAQGLSIKNPALVYSAANIVLSGAQTIDGIILQDGDRVLVNGQTDNTQNGIYAANISGTWTRTSDADTWDDLVGAFILVQSGAMYGNTQWAATISATGTIGTTPIMFSQFGGIGTYTAGTGLDLIGTQFSLANTTVVAASYGQADSTVIFTVNAQGQLTTAAAIPILITPAQAGLSNITNTVKIDTVGGISGNNALTFSTNNSNISLVSSNAGAGVTNEAINFSNMPSFTSETLTANTNQLVLGTTNTYTFTMATLTASRTFTLPNANSNSVQPTTAVASNWVRNIDSNGLQTLSRPNASDILVDTPFNANNAVITAGQTGLVAFQNAQGQINVRLSQIQDAQANIWVNNTVGTVTTATAPNATPNISGLIRNDGISTQFSNVPGNAQQLCTPLSQAANLLNNGGFNIWQRGTTFSITTQAKTFTADRWFIDTLSGNFVGTIDITRPNALNPTLAGFNPPARFAYRLVNSAYTSGQAYFSQMIENVNTFGANEYITFTIVVSCTAAQNFPVELVQYFGTGGSPSATVFTPMGNISYTAVGSYQQLSLTVQVPTIVGKTVGTANNDCVGIRIALPQNTNAVRFLNAQLQRGQISTNFDIVSPQSDWVNCMRYCESISSFWEGLIPAGNNNISTPIYFQAPMRGTPVVISTINNGNINFSATPGLSFIGPQFAVDTRQGQGGLVGGLGRFASTYLLESELIY